MGNPNRDVGWRQTGWHPGTRACVPSAAARRYTSLHCPHEGTRGSGDAQRTREHNNSSIPAPLHTPHQNKTSRKKLRPCGNGNGGCRAAVGACPVADVAHAAAGRSRGSTTPGGPVAAVCARLRCPRSLWAKGDSRWSQSSAGRQFGGRALVRGGIAVGSRGGGGLHRIRFAGTRPVRTDSRAPPPVLACPHDMWPSLATGSTGTSSSPATPQHPSSLPTPCRRREDLACPRFPRGAGGGKDAPPGVKRTVRPGFVVVVLLYRKTRRHVKREPHRPLGWGLARGVFEGLHPLSRRWRQRRCTGNRAYPYIDQGA